MISRLYFTVTLVVLAWVSISTCRAAGNAINRMTLVYNDTVSELKENLNDTGCRSSKLCVSEPANCTISNGSCHFVSTKNLTGDNFEISLAGVSDGYVAAVLSLDSTLGGNDTAYVCFIKNGTVAFTGAYLDNDTLTKQNVSANAVKGKVNGTQIQCIFEATVSQTTKATSRTIGLVTGTYNGSTGTFGAAKTIIRTNAVDLADPSAFVQNNVNISTSTTMSPNVTTGGTTSGNTTSNAMSFRQTLIQALFISAGVMGLAVL